MNIFQHLGLAEEHRPKNKVTQLVKHYEEVTEKNKTGKRHAVQIKEDGVCALTVVQNGITKIFSRTGNKFTNCRKIEAQLNRYQLADGVYFGEMVNETCSLEVLSGMVSPNRVKPLDDEQTRALSYNRMRLFDMISINEFSKGSSDTPFCVRYEKLLRQVPLSHERYSLLSTVELTLIFSEDSINELAEASFKDGEEGIVVIDLDADWLAGHKGWRKMKLVRGVDYDLLCIGYEEGTGKYKGKVANLIFRWKGGKTIKAMLGKGWTHDMAEEMFDAQCAYESGNTRESIKASIATGKIFQVVALEESSKGKLRLPKVHEQRFDKVEADV